MGQPTSITALTDATEYSRYEAGRDTVTVTVGLSGNAPYSAESILIEMIKARRSRDAVVATTTLSFTGSTSPEIQYATFHLPDVVDQDFISLIRFGKYFIRARSLATGAVSVLGNSSAAPFTVTLRETGTVGNTALGNIVVPSGNSPLFATFNEISRVLTISLATIGGVPDSSKNTQAQIVSVINASVFNDVVASYTGLGTSVVHIAEPSVSFNGGRDEVSTTSADFDIRIITTQRFRNDWLFGIPLIANNVRMVKFPPTNITGIQIVEVTPQHRMGAFTLQYNYIVDAATYATAAIGSGGNGVVTTTAKGTISGSAGNAYSIHVVVPVSGTTPLTVSVTGTVITVQLAVITGTLDPTQNTALLVAAAISALGANFAAVASGNGSTAITTGVTVSFAGGTDAIHRTLSWAGGPTVSVDNPGIYVLRAGYSSGSLAGACGNKILSSNSGLNTDYIVVRVLSPALLPTVSTTDDLIIERLEISDQALADAIDSAVSWLEQDALDVYLEPTNIVTERDATTIQFGAGINAPNPIFADTDFDFIKEPLTHFTPRTSENWVGIQTPYYQLLRIDSFFGAIANTRVIDIDLDWIQFSNPGGFIQLVPFNQTVAFNFIGLLWVNSIQGVSEIPNFWHFNIIAGLRDTPPDLQELIGKKAAIDILAVVGAALRPGIGSVSLGRDGVSQSISYATQQQFGPYSGLVNSYKMWIDEHLKDYKGKMHGLRMVVC